MIRGLSVLIVATLLPGGLCAQGDIPYVATPQPVIDAMLELAQIRPGDVLADLGSGDGRIPITAAQRYGIEAIGVDIDPERVRQADQLAAASGVKDKVRLIRGDLFALPLRGVTVVTAYLLPSVNLRLRPKLLAELPAGARIVTYKFDMGSWKPDRTAQVGNETVYLWTVPASRKAQLSPPEEGVRKPVAALSPLYAYVKPAHPSAPQPSLLPSPKGVVVESVVYEGQRGPVPGVLVRPGRPGRHAAVVFLHDAGRRHDQFLGEAVALARAARDPLASLLVDAPASRPPGWRRNYNPTEQDNDRSLCIQAVVDVRLGLDLLTARQEIDPTRLAVAGHGYGAIWAGILAGVDPRLRGAVLVSPLASLAAGLASDDPDSADLRYAIGPARFAGYLESLRDFDLPPYLDAVRPGNLLLQFGRYDPFLAFRYRERLAAPGRQLRLYDAGQDVHAPDAVADRERFLRRLLQSGPAARGR